MGKHLRLIIGKKSKEDECDFHYIFNQKPSKRCLGCASLDECLTQRLSAELEHAIAEADNISGGKRGKRFPRLYAEVQNILLEASNSWGKRR